MRIPDVILRHLPDVTMRSDQCEHRADAFDMVWNILQRCEHHYGADIVANIEPSDPADYVDPRTIVLEWCETTAGAWLLLSHRLKRGDTVGLYWDEPYGGLWLIASGAMS